MLLNPEKNLFISNYDYNSELEYNSSDYDNYFKTIHKEISDVNDNYLKVFWQKDTSFHIPKVLVSIYFFHPFLRPNFHDYANVNEKLKNKNNDKLFFEYLLYLEYIKRAIKEQLADAFRAGGNFFSIGRTEVFRGLEIFIFSDKVKTSLDIINNIISNETNFISELGKRFEMYKQSVLRELLYIQHNSISEKIMYAFYESITKDEENNLLPIYNFYNFPIYSFTNITFEELNNDDLAADVYSIKYIYLFGYYNESEAREIYKLFNSTDNFDFPLKSCANFSDTKISVSNFVEWALNKSSITKNSTFPCRIDYNYTTYFITFVKYTLKTSCISEMLIDILYKNNNFNNFDLVILTAQQTFIYLGFVFEKKTMENGDLMNKIIEWLKENDKMNKKVDVIGDKFYYFFKGYKKIKSLKHYNIYDSARQNTLDHIYNTHDDNNILEFEIKKYENFIEEIRKLIYSNIPYIKIYQKND